MVRLCAAFMFLFLASCSPPSETVSTALPSASNAYPKKENRDEALIQEFEEVERWRDFFEVDEILEFDSSMILAEVFRSVIHPKGYLVVIDSIQQRILVFDMNGKYIRDLGRVGQGPGEYGDPLSISLGFNNSIVISDNVARAHAFSIDGTHLASTSFGGGVKQTFSGVALWPERNQVILSGIHSTTKATPLHMIVDHSTDIPQVQHKFGHRLFSSHLDRYSHDTFKVIDNTIWYHSPYTSYIEFYDLDGDFLGQSLPIPGAKRTQLDDLKTLEPLTKESLDSYLREKLTPFGLYQFKDLVIADSLRYFDVYSTSGNLIAKNIKGGRSGLILGQYKERILTRIGSIEDFNRYAEDFKPHLLQICKGDTNKLIDSNGFIVFWRQK